MERIDELRGLLAKVEAGKIGDGWQNFESIPPNQWQVVKDAHNGSLDAAKALHEAVLVGWGASISVKERDDGFVMAWVSQNSNRVENAIIADCREYHISPARAWLIAIIKALIAKETT